MRALQTPTTILELNKTQTFIERHHVCRPSSLHPRRTSSLHPRWTSSLLSRQTTALHLHPTSSLHPRQMSSPHLRRTSALHLRPMSSLQPHQAMIQQLQLQLLPAGPAPQADTNAPQKDADNTDVQIVAVQSARNAWQRKLRKLDLYDIDIGELDRERCVYLEDFSTKAANALQEEMQSLNNNTVGELSEEDMAQQVRNRL